MSYQYPFPIFVYPTLHCNFSCSYCFNMSGPSEPVRSFLLENWEQLLDDCAELHVPEIRLSGGEPLLISDLPEKCQAIHDRGIRYTLLTNGSNLNRHLEWLSINPPQTLWISYHREFSSTKIFERQVASAAGVIESVGIHVFSCDVEMDPLIVERAVGAGAKRVKILSLTSIGRCADAGKALKWSRSSAEAKIARWQRLSRQTLEVRVEAPILDGVFTGSDSCVLRERPLLSINHDGSVYPCCVTLGRESTMFGSLQRDTMESLLRRAKSTAGQLPCENLLPAIRSKKACCPLRLVSLSSHSQEQNLVN